MKEPWRSSHHHISICDGSVEGGRFDSSNNNPSHLKMCREICGNQNVLPQVR